MRIRHYAPTEAERDKIDALRDQAMRFMELVELNHIKTLEDAIGYFGDRAAAYGYIMRADKWVMGDDGLMDQQATIERERNRQDRKAKRQQQTLKGGETDTESDH